jgi:hypothetical protein
MDLASGDFDHEGNPGDQQPPDEIPQGEFLGTGRAWEPKGLNDFLDDRPDRSVNLLLQGGQRPLAGGPPDGRDDKGAPFPVSDHDPILSLCLLPLSCQRDFIENRP